MQSKEQILEYIETAEIEVLFLPDEYDCAIIGLVHKFNDYSILYDTTKCIEILMNFHGMEYGDAVEYFDFNISGAYLGSNICTFTVDID